MAHALVEGYINERDKILNTINVLKNTNLDRGSDPSEQDLEVMTKGYERIDRLDYMIKVLGEDRRWTPRPATVCSVPPPPRRPRSSIATVATWSGTACTPTTAALTTTTTRRPSVAGTE